MVNHLVAVVSGGLDSVTLAHWLARRTDRLTLLSVNYGQRHVRELACAQACADRLGADWVPVDLSGLGTLLSGSALTDATPLPEGHYTDDTMKATVVPNRNAILLNVGIGLAVARGANGIATAVHAGDHAIYPDCRPAFTRTLQRLARIGTEGFSAPDFAVLAPFVTWSKADIVRAGHRVGVPFAETWSCYAGADVHCGRCGTCVERIEAFQLAGVPDPTVYATEAVSC